ncbi:DUF3240 family protein [Helicobacter himalayensis]|uniref:DUF3240 family protein n=1 Tax=Helicobacter himalayensis TaxID=1591088 RepID=UPI00082D414B|nr:DUF3240 family protein [Helicobacter himalayensis]
MEELILEIYFKHNLKDSLVDMLLEDGFDDFFYHKCSKYASTSLLTSPKEQVSGRQEYGLLRICLSDERAKFLANKLLQAFGTEDIKLFKAQLERFVL